MRLDPDTDLIGVQLVTQCRGGNGSSGLFAGLNDLSLEFGTVPPTPSWRIDFIVHHVQVSTY
jgi:hypothetical protein